MVAAYVLGDLVWAKMKGFPPWPASVTGCPKILRDGTTSQGKYTVTFFGTRETAQMKASELFPYREHRLAFEKSRKVKGFNEGIKEIRCAAGLDEDEKTIVADRTRHSSSRQPSTNSRTKEEVKSSTRIRKPSSRIPTDEFILSPTRVRGVSKSADTIQNSNNSSRSAPAKPASAIPQALAGIKRNRIRTDSNSSSTGSITKRSKRVSYSDKYDMGLDLDPLLNSGTDAVFLNSTFDSNMLSLDEHVGMSSSVTVDDSLTERRRSRRRTRSRFLDDLLMSPSKSPFHDRSRSISSNGGRSRLISGYSDTLEDLLDSAHAIFNPNDLMAAIDQLPSEDSDRPLTPEEPLPMPAPLKTCYSCGCQCELLALKWRCTNKQCLKWNGPHRPHPVGSDVEDGAGSGPTEKSSEQLEIEKAVNAIKREASNFEEEYHQQQQRKFQQQQQGRQHLSDYNATSQYDVKYEQHQASTSSAGGHFASGTATAVALGRMKASDLSQSFDQFSAFAQTHASGDSAHFYSSAFEGGLTTVAGADASSYLSHGGGFVTPGGQQPTAVLGPDGMGVRKKSGRPKSYKVEKTPPIRADGRRLCALCSGEVRPQMCGGNKHRWRCVDKKCRKWYGWVLSCDEIPMDLGKKGRWKDLVVKVRQPGGAYDEDLFAANSLSAHLTQQPKRIGRPPKMFMEDDPNLDKIRTKFPASQNGDLRMRRKYTKKKRDEDIEIQRPISPLTLRQMSYEPSAVERHSRWWLTPRRRANVEMSPPRDFPTSVISNAASLRLIGSAMLTGADSRADEPGTIDGTLDLLMDALISSMAPLLSLVNKLPYVTSTPEHDEVIQKLWKTSAVHTPMF